MKSVADQWDHCPSGAFRQLSQRLVRRRRQRMIARVGGVASVAVVLVLAFWLAPREATYADITCTRVNELAPDYKAGKLSRDLHDQIDRHLSQCSHCRDLYHELGLVKPAGAIRLTRLSGATRSREPSLFGIVPPPPSLR